jgi:hypothetical protein
VEAGHIL